MSKYVPCIPVAIVMACSSAIAAPSTRNVDSYPQALDDGYGVMHELSRGGTDYLRDLSKAPVTNAAPYLAKPAYLRATFRLDESSAASKACVETARERKAHSAEMICTLIAAGNSLVLGRVGDWASAIEKARAQFYPLIRKEHGAGLRIDVLEKVENYKAFADWPAPSYRLQPLKQPARLSFLPLQASDARWSSAYRGAVDLTVNGKQIRAAFDTGSFMSLFSADTARSIELRLTPGWWNGSEDPRVDAPATSLGAASVTTLGPLRVDHLPVAVAPKGMVNTIGLDIMIGLKRFKMDSEGVSVLSEADTECIQPLVMSSTLNGMNSRLRAPIKVNGTSVLAVIDTGSSDYIMRVAPRSEAVRGTSDIESEHVFSFRGVEIAKFSQQKESIDFGWGDLQRPVKTVYGDAKFTDYIIGIAALADASIYIDFAQRHLCVTKNLSQDGSGP